jgi:hypothetical protein
MQLNLHKAFSLFIISASDIFLFACNNMLKRYINWKWWSRCFGEVIYKLMFRVVSVFMRSPHWPYTKCDFVKFQPSGQPYIKPLHTLAPACTNPLIHELLIKSVDPRDQWAGQRSLKALVLVFGKYLIRIYVEAPTILTEVFRNFLRTL